MRFIGLIRQESSANRPEAWSVCLAVALTVGCLASVTDAAANTVPAAMDGAAQPQLTDSPLLPVPDYSTSTDYELTSLGARWDELSGPERAALLREVKLRMARRKDANGVLMIRTQRRYGRVYGGSGSSRYLKIETKVIRVRPSGEEAARAGFGVGFEQRKALPESVPAETSDQSDTIMSPPVVHVHEPSS